MLSNSMETLALTPARIGSRNGQQQQQQQQQQQPSQRRRRMQVGSGMSNLGCLNRNLHNKMFLHEGGARYQV